MILWILPNHYKDPILTKFYPPQFFFKKRAKKEFLGTFCKIFDQKTAFFLRALPF